MTPGVIGKKDDGSWRHPFTSGARLSFPCPGARVMF
ncbi:MAG: CRISPR-associated protein Cas5 [Spirochaetota bacterium]